MRVKVFKFRKLFAMAALISSVVFSEGTSFLETWRQKDGSWTVGGKKVDVQETMELYDPTYDTTFKALFSGVDDTAEDGGDLSSSKANKRLLSLLNSMCYPEYEIDSTKEHLTECKVIDSSFLIRRQTLVFLNAGTNKRNKPKKVTLDQKRDNTDLSELRCDLICECKSSKSSKKKRVLVYFDVEMQRAKVPDRTVGFANYRELLKRRVEKLGYGIEDVQVIAFTNYEAEDAVGEFKVGLIQRKNGKLNVAADQRLGKDSDYVKMISLPACINDLKKGNKITVNGKNLNDFGKEWLKLLGLGSWAGAFEARGRCEIPARCNFKCKGVGSAMRALKADLYDEKAYEAEVLRLFGRKTEDRAIREEAIEEGEARGEARGEAKGQLKEQLVALWYDFCKARLSASSSSVERMKEEKTVFSKDQVRNFLEDKNGNKEGFLSTLEEVGLLSD